MLGLGAIGGVCGVSICTMAPLRSERWPSLPASGSHPVDPAGRRQRADRQGAAGEQAAAAEGREEGVQRTDFFEQFLGRGAPARPARRGDRGAGSGSSHGAAPGRGRSARDLPYSGHRALPARRSHGSPRSSPPARRPASRWSPGSPASAPRGRWPGRGCRRRTPPPRRHAARRKTATARWKGAAELERSHALRVFAFEEDFRAEFFVVGTRDITGVRLACPAIRAAAAITSS